MEIDEMTIKDIAEHLSQRPMRFVLAWNELGSVGLPEATGDLFSNLGRNETLWMLNAARSYVKNYSG